MYHEHPQKSRQSEVKIDKDKKDQKMVSCLARFIDLF